MNPRPALLKPTVRPPEPPRPRNESTTSPARHERARDWRSETRDESECFEQLLTALDSVGQPTPTAFSDAGFAGQQQQDQAASGAAPPPLADTTALYEALLTRLEEQLAALDDGPLEAHLQLPNLGAIAVRVTQRGERLEIALRFANDNAWEHCQANQPHSAAWLSQQLGRQVCLSLHREVH
ncbi:type III secretion system HrpP C-terminal domain-containing protein [Pseudomonas sp. N3-W]|uniref:type III secretion system HrpP C-terminal domain-containing protein n=1 Tax=Pseudomonas sp. N3-W TaxID=2975049 RepID=UPI00217D9020|nr:type III secretion system HrpP C-terminal domain-containing protein [Pseudomonas sp. N3-W]UWF47435.1 type III secretion system HrpP C-terminal domain-containing protein [Pseudomonas sp. N3-W]